MTDSDRLEIINANGEVTFYVLDPAKGVTNIGSDPENDLVLVDERVPPFQAMLDHRQKPYRLMLLTQEGHSVLAGNSLLVDKSVELQNWDQLEFGRYTLVLVEGQPGRDRYQVPQASPTSSKMVQPITPVNLTPPTRQPEHFSGSNQDWSQLPETPPDGILRSRLGAGQYQTPLPDHEDEDIYIQLAERERTINLEQNEMAISELEITNRGNRVAAFNIYVEGLDQSWVQITPPQINLRERQSGQVRLAITPRKEPTSYAGPHYFVVVVSSPNYNNRFSQSGAMIEILPYYQFSVEELSPKVHTISWFKQAGETSIVITNLGNSEMLYQLEGGDRENSCNYEFQIPGESVTLANQASLHLLPVGRRDEAIDPDIQLEPHRTEVPITVIPNSRPLFLRRRTHHYEIKVIPTEGQQSPKSQLGELRQQPLFGIIPVLLMTLLLLLFCGSSVWFLFGPRIYTFTVDGETTPKTIDSGEEVTLEWEASPFASLRITTNTEADIGWLQENVGERTDKPLQRTTYTLEGSNILSTLFFFPTTQRELQVEVVPIVPNIREFTIEPNNIVLGEEAILSWSVANADEVTLSSGSGLPESLPTEQYIGQRLVSPADNTTYSMQASNFNGQSNKNATIAVVTPTGTPVTPPEVQFFNVSPNQIILGESVTLNWSVTNADSVVINPIPGSLPLNDDISQTPQETTLYVLEARKAGAAPVSRVQEVAVIIPTGTPSPTSTPAAPLIVDFAASDDTLIVGGEDGDDTVTLFWAVQGDVTDIQLANTDNVIIQTQLTPAAQIEVPIDEDTELFTLTAFNQDKSNRQSVTLDIQTPTPEPTPEPPTPTPLPTPQILLFEITIPSEPEVVQTNTGQGSRTYDVQQNTEVTFEWRADQAATLTELRIDREDGDIVAVGTDRGTYPNVEIEETTIFVLIAKNADGEAGGTNTINVRVVDKPLPPSPTDLIGDVITTSTRIDLEWDYRRSDEDLILGFRIYRSDTPPFTEFGGPIIEEDILGSRSRDFSDTDLTRTCDLAYFVVAVDEGVDGDTRETDASVNSWFSPPC